MGKAPLVLDINGWTVLDTNLAAEHVRRFGPTIAIDIWSVNQTVKLQDVLAQIDFGASHSCISPRLAPRLNVEPIGVLNTQIAGLKPEDIPVFRCGVTFPTGTKIEGDFAILPHLAEPHDVLIGRNILANCRVIVDFTSGNIQIHFKNPE
ncbi:MAG: hypothetical protein HYW28_12740 [Rhodospirillales bacterium]|nr:hypothetical protein [Rhodospirillales bacterium]